MKPRCICGGISSQIPSLKTTEALLGIETSRQPREKFRAKRSLKTTEALLGIETAQAWAPAAFSKRLKTTEALLGIETSVLLSAYFLGRKSQNY